LGDVSLGNIPGAAVRRHPAGSARLPLHGSWHFLCRRSNNGWAVKGVLADHPDPKTEEEMAEFLAHYMPMKFGSSLTAKLKKKDKDGRSYWERGDANGVPFLLAIADFHISGSEISNPDHS
jgi:hypothetical protein